MKKILIPFLCLFFCIVFVVLFTYKNLASKEDFLPIVVVKTDKNVIKDGDNILPIFDDLTLSVLGFDKEPLQGNLLNLDRDLTVKITATNARDIDGGISYYKWYYYYKDDPDRKLEVKVTPGAENYTYFQLKESGEYGFGVIMYDNKDGETVSEYILGGGPTLLLVQDTKNTDIPIVTLKVDKNAIELGDEVEFHVFSKVISDRSDFLQERTIRYDFDGDGERDLITKDDEVTYIYEKENLDGWVPRASVIYRGYEGTAKGESIIVRQGLKPELLITKAGKYVLFRDMSTGPIEKSVTCLSLIDCNKNNNGFLVDSKDMPYYIFKYPEYQKYFISMDVQDEAANIASQKIAINLTGVVADDGKIVDYTGDIKLLTIPEVKEKSDGIMEIFVGNNLKNSVLFYVLVDEKSVKNCYVDADLSDDNDQEFSCNEAFLKEYTPQYTSKVGKIHYEKDGKEITKKFTVSFLDYSVKLTSQQQEYYDKISELLKTVNDEKLRVLLLKLQQGLLSESEIEANIIAIYDYLTNDNNIDINDAEKQEIKKIVNDLSNTVVVLPMGGTVYDIAKAEILGVLPRNLRVTVKGMFNDFEIAESNFEKGTSQLDERKEKLQQILNLIKSKTVDDLKNKKEDEITKSDLNEVIIPNICKIFTYYSIVNDICN